MDLLQGRDGHRTYLIAEGLSPEEAEKFMNEAQREALTKGVAKDIAKERGISLSHAYKLISQERERVGEAYQPPEGWSKKDHVLEALYRINATAGVGAEALGNRLRSMGIGVTMQDLNGVLWDLQKQQYVKFSESHTSSGSVLIKIRLTIAGRRRVEGKREKAQEPAGAEYAGPKMKPGSSRRSRQVGTDMTSWANHGTKAKGGPVEIVQEGTHEATPEVVPSIDYSLPTLGDPLPQNMKAPYAEPVRVNGIDLGEYPAILDLKERAVGHEIRKGKAAKMVEAASMISDIDPEEADRLMSRAGDLEGPGLTKLEIEVLRFLEEVTS